MERVIRFILHLLPPTPQRLFDAGKFYLILWKKKRIKAKPSSAFPSRGQAGSDHFAFLCGPTADSGRQGTGGPGPIPLSPEGEEGFFPFSLRKDLVMIKPDVFETPRRKI
jgi:hypothetical protein